MLVKPFMVEYLQFYNMRVSKKLQVLNLSSDFTNHIQAFDFLAIQHFDGNFMASKLMLSS